MPSFTLWGVTVNFPYPPYSCQKDYMEKVVECLQKMQNGVLESPTGTGKTLSLLCATLAWRENFKDSISARKITKERLAGDEMFRKTPPDGDTPTYITDVPKIVYASRTYSQLAQVISELKKTSYRPKVCVLGSIEQLCINQEVTCQENNHIMVHMCRGKFFTSSCLYYNNVEEKNTDRDLGNSILDVEDLVKFGNKERVCHYYLSQPLSKEADVIFMPYNYLLDPKYRRAHNIKLNGAVIIFDEAHNVGKTCEDLTSFDLTPYDIASAISAVDRLLVEEDKAALSWDSGTEDFIMESASSGLKMDIFSIAEVKQILFDLETAIDSYDVPADKGITKPGSFIYELLERANLTYSSKAKVFETLEHILGHFAETGIVMNTIGLQKLSDIIQLVFSGEPAEKDRLQQMQTSTAHFKVHIHKDTSHHSEKQTTDMWASSPSKKQGNVLSYWCFSPGFRMQDLVNQGVRCIILTSSTLSPLTSFAAEMRIPFPVSLENRHVIERDQIFVSIIERGPDRVYLSSAFDRCPPESMASLGNTVANLCRVVPHGLLVFFPSLALMEKTLEFWRANGHADRIGIIKPMFVEPKRKETFIEIINAYYNKVNDPAFKGGSFFAVCQGKASEGLDFVDTFGRGVIITGLPFPSRTDPWVILKTQFLDEMCRKKVPGLKYLSGNEWYNLQAYRAVNQAIGRVIHHKEDFGAIFLCDQRFKHSDARAQLPSWLRPYVRVYDSFGNVVRDVCQFFRVAQKLKKSAAAVAEEDFGFTCFPGASSCSQSQNSNAQKAKMLVAHMPSLRRRLFNVQTGSASMARICAEYEAQHSQRRPVNFVDAMERRDKHREEDNVDADVEEEKNDQRMDDEMRVGKRKIKLVQEQSSDNISEESKANRIKTFLADMKKSLSQVTFHRIMQALQTYKTTENLDLLLTEVSVLTEDTNTHSLMRGFYQFVRPHHKQMFDEKCQALTGQGCGSHHQDLLSNDEKKALMQQSAQLTLPQSKRKRKNKFFFSRSNSK